MKTQPSISRYIEVLCILLAVKSKFLVFPHGRDLNNKYTFLCFVDSASQYNDRHFYQLHAHILFYHIYTNNICIYILYVLYLLLFLLKLRVCASS